MHGFNSSNRHFTFHPTLLSFNWMKDVWPLEIFDVSFKRLTWFINWTGFWGEALVNHIQFFWENPIRIYRVVCQDGMWPSASCHSQSVSQLWLRGKPSPLNRSALHPLIPGLCLNTLWCFNRFPPPLELSLVWLGWDGVIYAVGALPLHLADWVSLISNYSKESIHTGFSW